MGKKQKKGGGGDGGFAGGSGGPSGAPQQQQQQQQQPPQQSRPQKKHEEKGGGDTGGSSSSGKKQEKSQGGPGGDVKGQGPAPDQQQKQGGRKDQQQQQQGGRKDQQQQQQGGRKDQQQQQQGGRKDQQQQQQGGRKDQQQQEQGGRKDQPQQQQGGRKDQQQQQQGGRKDQQQQEQGGRKDQPQQQQGGRKDQLQQQQGGRKDQQQQQQDGRKDQPQQQQGGRKDQQQQQQGGRKDQQQQQQGGRKDQPQQQQGGRKDQQQQQQGGRRDQQPQGGWGHKGQQQQQPGQPAGDQQPGPRGGQQQGQRKDQRQQQQQQPQKGGWGQQQQPQHQQQQGAWGQQQPQHQQQQGAWGQQQPQHQQQQGAWGQQQPRQQQGPRQQQQQQGPRQQQQPRQQHAREGKDAETPTTFSPSTSATVSRSPSLQSVSSQVSKMSIRDQKLKKPEDSFETSGIPVTKGTKGNRIKIEVNYIDLNVSNMIDVAWQYDVTFEPDAPKKFFRLAFKEFSDRILIPKQILMAFDGQKIAYCHVRVDRDILNTPHEVKILEPITRREKNYKITLKETVNPAIELKSLRNYRNERIFDKPMRAVQCLDIVLRQALFYNTTTVRAGRSFYMQPTEKIDIKDSYELWLGLFQAAVLGEKPFLNIDISHKAFPSAIPVINHYDISDPTKELDYRSHDKINQFLRNLEILYQPPGYENPSRFKCNGLADIPAKCIFTRDDQQTDNVLNYFQNEKNIRIRYPNLPCLSVGIRQLKLPMEFCTVAWGQATNKKTGENQVREIIRTAATSTDTRKRRILDIFNKFDYATNPIINRFGIFVGKDFLNIDARILNAPTLQYAQNTVRPFKGSWRLDKETFIEPKRMLEWTILITDNRTSDFNARDLAKLMVKVGQGLNMNINEKCEIRKIREDSRTLEQELIKAKQGNKDMVVVIISGMKNSYSMVKQLAENHHGVLTQCIKGQTVQRRLDHSTVQNILLKVNAKLTGINHKIASESQPTFRFDDVMFIGADVTHPTPDQRQVPSVVGVAATYDRHGFQYNMRYRLQDPTQEIIQDMEDILREQLLYYKQKENRLPQKIIYYRDGVSDGQFQQVRQMEINSMYRACAKVQNGYKPNITCIIVQKRHHTRFFPPPNSNIGKLDRKYNNVPPGTIVDGTITHPAENQFFLVSHESIQGVAKPTKYCLIWDDSKLNIDDLQAMTYSLCHMFTRCNRAVSYPAPAYYAHLAASRGKVYIDGARSLNMRNLRKEYEQRQIREEILVNKPMFFV